MKYFLILLLFITSVQVKAQKFYFPKEQHRDTATLAAHIDSLAVKLMAVESNANKKDYYDNMFRYAIVAGKYQTSITYLDSVRGLRISGDTMAVKGILFHYEMYARAKLLQQQSKESFQNIFTRVFAEHYRLLSADSKATLNSYTSEVVADLKLDLDRALLASAKSDTLEYAKAKALVRAYNLYKVYSASLSDLKKFVAAEDRRVFNVQKVLIKTKDGSTVQAVVVRKRELKEKLSTVFMFNIYADSAGDIAHAKQYALAGYAGIVANTRGKGSSPQIIEPFEHDASDAYDIIDWINKQKWSNKKVGMTGGSYLGFAQWAAAKTLHPALKTIMPEVAAGSGIDFPMDHNIFMSYMLQWIHYVSNTKQTDYADFNNTEYWDSVFKKWYASGASFRSLDTIEGRPNAIFQRWLQHTSFDSYWQDMTSYKTDFSRINIPVLTTTGYFDEEQGGALYYYREHYLNNPAANNYLVIGPYGHTGAQGYPTKIVDGYTVDSIATTFNFFDLSVQWFNYILKDSAKPSLLKDKVNYQVMGKKEWRHASSLAGMQNDTLTLFLGNTRVDDHYKLETTPAPNDYIKQEVDFKDRSDSSNDYAYLVVDSVINKKNSISFTSAPLDKPMIVSGSFIGNLQVAINKKDMDTRITMYEQMPDGKFFTLGHVYSRASYARDKSNRHLLVPGMKESIPINISFMTCKELRKNSRLIIVVSIVKENAWQINYGTGKDVSDETIADAIEPLEIKWFADSYLKIPVWK